MDSKAKIEVVKFLMKSRGMKHLHELADKMMIKPNTLTSNLRYMTSSESYDSKFAEKLFAILGITKTDFFEALDKGIIELSDNSLSKIKKKSQFFHQVASSYQTEIREQLEAMKDGDYYTLITTDRPWEFDNADMRKVILNCLKSGAQFRYLYPKNTSVTKSYFENYSASIDWDNLGVLHERYLKVMAKMVSEDEGFSDVEGFNSNNPMDFISDRLKCFLIDDLWLITPFHKYIILDRQDYGGVHQIAFVETKFVEAQTGMNNDQNSFWVPLPTNDQNRLIENVERIILQ